MFPFSGTCLRREQALGHPGQMSLDLINRLHRLCGCFIHSVACVVVTSRFHARLT